MTEHPITDLSSVLKETMESDGVGYMQIRIHPDTLAASDIPQSERSGFPIGIGVFHDEAVPLGKFEIGVREGREGDQRRWRKWMGR
jgi:hypothetical protein